MSTSTSSVSPSINRHNTSNLPNIKNTDNSVKNFIKAKKFGSNRSDIRGCLAVFGNYLVIASLIVISELSFSNLPMHFAVPIYAALVLGISSRYRGFENLVHEASHHNLFKHGFFYKTCQFFYADIVFKHEPSYKDDHTKHHKFFMQPGDPDYNRYLKLGMDNMQEGFYWKMFGRPLCLLEHYYFVRESLPLYFRKATYGRIVWFSILCVILYYPVVRTLFVFYYVVPFFGILPVTRYLAEMSEHVGTNFLEGYVARSRSNIGFFHRWILHPYGDGYHAIHHLSKTVPFYNLKEAHELVVENFPKANFHTSYSVWETVSQMRS